MNEFLLLAVLMIYFAICYSDVWLPGSRTTPPAFILPSTRQTSNASGEPHKYTDGHYLIVVPEATAPRSGR